MNKLVIPSILLATVMVAGMFAFMPVEQASTVHTTVTGSQLTQVVTYYAEASTTAVEATSNADFMLTVCFTDFDLGSVDAAIITDAAGGGGNNIANAASLIVGVAQCVTVGGQADDVYTITPTNDNGAPITYATLLTTSDAAADIAAP